MFDKILIANRGEIAVRVIRTCQRMGIHTIAVYSDADADAAHVRLADEVHRVGEAPVGKSYLNMERILQVAKESGAQAVHPGYGLLSENARFVEMVEQAGIVFIGPRSQVMELMGDKAQARTVAEKAGVPVVPGSPGPVAGEDAAVAAAEELGYPVLVKAAAGGGGIGMKVAKNEKKLRKAYQSCQRRAMSSFGDDTIYIERYIQNPRHIEVQVIADTHGNAVHLFERECSVQRRHQKVIEEAPSPFVSKHEDINLRARMTEAALALVNATEYTNAGTLEFIVGEDASFYFIEMNTRLQVEHTVTEEITGVDLVEWQIRVAFGESLPMSQDALTISGHAIECRIYAENPAKKFMPAPGHIGAYTEPSGPGVRVDSGVHADSEVTPYYDPMLAKLITHGADRDEAIARMRGALDAYQIEELVTNLSMHAELLRDEDFVAGDFHTGWLEARGK